MVGRRRTFFFPPDGVLNGFTQYIFSVPTPAAFITISIQNIVNYLMNITSTVVFFSEKNKSFIYPPILLIPAKTLKPFYVVVLTIGLTQTEVATGCS